VSAIRAEPGRSGNGRQQLMDRTVDRDCPMWTCGRGSACAVADHTKARVRPAASDTFRHHVPVSLSDKNRGGASPLLGDRVGAGEDLCGVDLTSQNG